MVAPRCLLYSDGNYIVPSVCAVDDAWFEGTISAPLFARLGLGGIHRQDQALSRLRDRLHGDNSADGDSSYLLLLVEQCIQNGFNLKLCNFEGLEDNWGKLNTKGTAILLDLNYTDCPDGETAGLYGVRLIRELLQGQRPCADIFIVTAVKALYRSASSHYKIPTSVISSLLTTSGCPVTDDDRHPGVKLPCSPYGVFWIAQVWNFLFWLDENRDTDKAARIEVSENGHVKIHIPFVISKLKANFEEAVEKGGTGTLSKAWLAVREHKLPDALVQRLDGHERAELRTMFHSVKFSDVKCQIIRDEFVISWKGVER